MKTKIGLPLLIFLMATLFSFQELDALRDNPKLIKAMQKNDIGKFVRLAGSEEKAIEELISFSMPDTFFNEKEYLVWQRTGRLTELDHYASRRLQAIYWIIKIYNSDYRSTAKTESCSFFDDLGETVWDYQDLDVKQKSYYYLVILWSPVKHKEYYDRLGYVKTSSGPYQELEQIFKKWYAQMKANGLKHMREQGLSPINPSRYRLGPPS
jgi:hypothetical protein